MLRASSANHRYSWPAVAAACLLATSCAAVGPKKPPPQPPGPPPAGQATEELQQLLDFERAFDEKLWMEAQRRKRERRETLIPFEPGQEVWAQIQGLQAPQFLGRVGEAKVSIRAFEKSSPMAPFGALEVEVKASEKHIDGFLVIPLREGLELFDPESLRVGWWDGEAQRFEWIDGTGVLESEGLLWARIDRGGSYAVLGAITDPVLGVRIRALCDLQRSALSRDPRLGARLLDICPVILCPSLGAAPAGPAGFGPLGGSLCDLCTRTNLDVPFHACEPYTPEIPRLECPGGSAWSTVGPVQLAGHIRRVIVDPTDSDRLYAAAANGGIWTLDSVSRYPTSRWHPLTDQLDTLAMSSVAVAPSDGSILYAGAASGQVYRSPNRGLDWLPVGPSLDNAIVEIAVDPRNPDRLWAVNMSGLHLRRSDGAAWENVFPGNMTDIRLDPSNPDIIYLAEFRVGVHKSRNGGRRWRLVFDYADADSPEEGIVELALGVRRVDGTRQSDAGRTVVVRVADEVWVNQAGGRGSWTSLGKWGNAGAPKQLRWNHAVGVSPFDPRVIFAGGRVLHRRRADDTNTWDHVAGFIRGVHEDQHFVAFDPNNPDVVYIANDGGVYRSSDQGRTFVVDGSNLAAEISARRNLNLGLVTAEFYRTGVTRNKSMGNLFHSGIIGSADLDDRWWRNVEGHSWEFEPVLGDEARPDRFFVLSDKLYLRPFSFGGPSPTLLDYGEFKPVPSSGGDTIVAAIAADRRPRSGIVLAAADGVADPPHRLMITRTGGRVPVHDAASDTWSNQPDWEVAFATGSGSDNKITAVAFARLWPRAYAMTQDGRLFRNDDVDASTSWIEAGRWGGPGGDVRQMAVSPRDRDLIYAISGHRVRRSRAAGAAGTWEDVGGTTLPPTPITSIATHPRDGFVVFLGSDDGVYMSVDQGERWEPIDHGLPNARIRQIYAAGDFLYAVTYGRGLWRLPLCAVPRGS